ncbi:HD domain-containing protein [candidate division WWE3 bacterium]|uniref:HD domain-containing protein n=1 Tax=candidate division WWE3 bacterium TaxID=2053526 RepID=A0A955LKZ7_UNCKA|nr:HD domain-containing protein [candidate division WWE3 bacterium]
MTDLIRLSLPTKFTVFLDKISDETKTVIKGVYDSSQIQELANHTENNPWHDYENCLEHVEHVFANIQELLRLDFVKDASIQSSYKRYLSQLIDPEGTFSRLELLLIACSLHDISKGQVRPETDQIAPGDYYLITNDDGTTRGSGHEHASSLIVPELLYDSGLTNKELQHVVNLVDMHDTFSKGFYTENLSSLDSPDPESDARRCVKEAPEYALELMLHIIADEYGAAVTQDYRQYLLNEVVARYDLTHHE